MNSVVLISMLVTVQLCYCATSGSYSSSNAVNEEEEEYNHAQKIPVTMDVSNLNPDWFYVESLESGLIDVHSGYFVDEIVDDDDVLWESSEGWRCTHAFIESSSTRTLLVMGFGKGKEYRYQALLKENGEWNEVPMIIASELSIAIGKERVQEQSAAQNIYNA
ncbi:signal peptide containing protein [Theileria equi strain WA]|uniref:Signal peptide containing protein n=1 Tax=Theileria equi strain WA TaxID=1537102 RepID=L1LEF8_THEEQ|nr:signal peptide containing protein [Theileria equi strain WA]EKX73669.1 signal peptide containing protein [Theileria equi strain WA]|eukprot:XP_004833121.1 signal peptide containing protein [Theileria equi strain WA]